MQVHQLANLSIKLQPAAGTGGAQDAGMLAAPGASPTCFDIVLASACSCVRSGNLKSVP